VTPSSRVVFAFALFAVACESTAPTQLEVQSSSAASRPTYALAAAPTEVTVVQGTSATVLLTITRDEPFKKRVSLSATGLPEGVTATFNPVDVEGAESSVTLVATETATLGTFTVTITGSALGRPDVSTGVAMTVVAPVPPMTHIALDFCANEPALWFAYQNDGEPWTRVIPDENGTVAFDATPRVAIAVVRTLQNPGGILLTGNHVVSVLYVTSAQLEPLSGVPCVSGFGNRIINGTLEGLGTGETAVVSTHFLSFVSTAASPTYRATRKPDAGALDLLATRRSATGEPLSMVMRRGLDIANEGVVAPVNFASDEAVPVANPTYSVSGLRGNPLLFVDFWTNTDLDGIPTQQRIAARGGSAFAESGTFPAVPSVLTQAGDRHELTVRTGLNTDYSGVIDVFQTASARSLAIGPSLSVPTFSQIAGSPVPRFAAELPSQAEYGAMVRMVASTGSGGPVAVYTVDATAAFFSGTPGGWNISIPDLTTVDGWNSAWNIGVGRTATLEMTGWSVAAVMIPPTWITSTIPPAIRPFADGTTIYFAGRQSQQTTSLPQP
jgi:hypothetical protein